MTHVLAEPSAQMQHELDEWVAQTPTLSCRKRSSSSSSRRSKLDGKTDDMHSVPESAASKGASGTGRKRKKSVRRPKPMKESHTEEGQEHTGSDASQVRHTTLSAIEPSPSTYYYNRFRCSRALRARAASESRAAGEAAHS